VDSTRKSKRKKDEPNSVLEAALRYLAVAWSVIPVHGVVDGHCTCGRVKCTNIGKHPALGSWKEYQERLATKAEILRWFATHPERNIGIVTGKISNIVVLDIDGDQGREALAEAGHLIPDTVHARTGGGGDHYFFRYPEGGLGNSAGAIAPKVDVRGDGGFVVVAPSLHRSGRRYEWIVAPGEEE
jgi:hypothetical protein